MEKIFFNLNLNRANALKNRFAFLETWKLDIGVLNQKIAIKIIIIQKDKKCYLLNCLKIEKFTYANNFIKHKMGNLIKHKPVSKA